MILPALLLGVVFSVAIPTQTEQTVRLVCDEVLGAAATDKQCHHSNIEDEASNTLKYINAAMACVMLLVGGTYGVLADYSGRRLPWALMFLSVAVSVSPNLLVECGPAVLRRHWRLMFYLGSSLSGVLGGFASGLFCQFAYVADVVPHGTRGLVFAVVEAALGSGQVFGALIGGQLTNALGFTAPLCVCMGVCAACALYVACMPESLPRDHRIRSFDWRRANTVSALRAIFTMRSAFSSSPSFLRLVSASFSLGFIVVVVNATVVILYAQQQFDWSPATIGILLACQGVFRCIVVFGVLPRFHARIHSTVNELGLSMWCVAHRRDSDRQVATGVGLAGAQCVRVRVCVCVCDGRVDQVLLHLGRPAGRDGHSQRRGVLRVLRRAGDDCAAALRLPAQPVLQGGAARVARRRLVWHGGAGDPGDHRCVVPSNRRVRVRVRSSVRSDHCQSFGCLRRDASLCNRRYLAVVACGSVSAACG